MFTFTTATNMLLSLSKVPSGDTTNTTLLQSLWNDSRRTVASIRGGNWPWREFEKTVDTVADQDYVYIPNDMQKVTGVRVVVGSGVSATIYTPRLIYDAQKWQTVLAMRLGSNQYPYFCYQLGQKLLFSPIPSETGTDVTLIGRRALRDLSIADYTTGSIVSVANGGTAVVGTGTSWTTSMAGRYIRITESDTANKGDGYWYEIASVGSATTLTLTKAYQGTSIAAGTAAYVLGQITYEPEAYQMAPIYRSLALFFQSNSPLQNNIIANQYWRLYDGGLEAGLLPPGSNPGGLIGQMLEEANETFDGAYIPPGDRDINNIQLAPYYFPTQDASGFN